MNSKNKKFYPVAEPLFEGEEKKYAIDCIKTGWVSSSGKYPKLFEKAYAKFNKTKYAVAVSNGTVSLHLILTALGIKNGDEVIVSNFTYVAAATSILHVGAKPVFVDCDPKTYNIDTTKIEKKITSKTKAIIAVHLYGNPCNMAELNRISKKHNLKLIEDAAEAHGASYKNKIVGSIGVANSFSFFGNKTITTGEGGMVTTNSKKLYEMISLLKNQGQHQDDERYFHRIDGYNFRMTNVQAAIGLGQLKRIYKLIETKRKINAWYREFLRPLKNEVIFQKTTAHSAPSFWMNAFTLKSKSALALCKKLKKENIDTRPFFVPMNKLPFFKNKESFPHSESICRKGIIVPSGANLKKHDIEYISKKIINII